MKNLPALKCLSVYIVGCENAGQWMFDATEYGMFYSVLMHVEILLLKGRGDI